MKKKYLKFLGIGLAAAILVAGCGKKTEEVETPKEDTQITTEVEDTTETEKEDSATTETSTELVSMTDVVRPDIENINFADYVEVGDYTNLDIDVEKQEVSDDDVTAYINNMLSALATYNDITDRASKEGDKLTISYEGTIDGETFDGGSAENESFTLGEGFYLDDFEKALYDKNIGDIVDVDLTFPDDYNEDVAGKKAHFKIVIDNIQETVLPELNSETIASLSSTATTEEELRAEVKESLGYSLESSYRDETFSAVVEQVLKIATIKDYPEDMLSYYKNVLYSYYSEYATIYGVSMSEFLEKYCEMTEDEFAVQCEDYAKEASNQALVLYYIGDKENIEITDEEYASRLEELATEYGYDSTEALKEDINSYNGEYEMRENMYFDKVCQRIMELNSVE